MWEIMYLVGLGILGCVLVWYLCQDDDDDFSDDYYEEDEDDPVFA